ncbi:MAG: DUF4923 family protein [Muribaculaceae bacterium]|nr:DUF4923 family protein [Muribaculaceae bacterium]
MKSIKTILAIAAIMLSFSSAQAFDWESLKKTVTNVAGEDAGNVIDNILKTDNLEVSDLEGTWKTSGPSVSFKSENVLEKAGGAAAASTIENKLKPFYKKAGLENATFRFTKEGKLTITLKNGKKLTGSIKKGTKEGTMILTLDKLKKLGKLTTYVSKGTSLSIMFDATKLMKLVSSIASYSGSSSLTSITSLLNSYDGVYAGFKFDKE